MPPEIEISLYPDLESRVWVSTDARGPGTSQARSNRETTSTWKVWGNMSSGVASTRR